MANPENDDSEKSDQTEQRPEYPPKIQKLITDGTIGLSTLMENPLITEDDM